MSDFNFDNVLEVVTETNTKTEDKPKATYWLNFGVMNGELFIKLSGLALDTFGDGWKTKPSKVQQALVDNLLESAKKLAVGENKFVQAGAFTVQLVHVDVNKTVDENTANNLSVFANL